MGNLTLLSRPVAIKMQLQTGIIIYIPIFRHSPRPRPVPKPIQRPDTATVEFKFLLFLTLWFHHNLESNYSPIKINTFYKRISNSYGHTPDLTLLACKEILPC